MSRALLLSLNCFPKSSPKPNHRNPKRNFNPNLLGVYQLPNRRPWRRIYAENGENGKEGTNGLPAESGNGGTGGARFNVKWLDLVLNPDPDNIVAVGLTGLLALASAQLLWQLFVIAGAILFAALKYTFVAALLILILVTLL